MAWIESHQELARHPKTKRLARAAGMQIPAAIGHLHLLWWWALDYAQSGELTDYTPEDIADAALWEGDPATFTDALIEAGFIDREDEQLFIHDWHDYAGRLLEKREYNRERMKRAREAKKAEPASDEQDTNKERARTVHARKDNDRVPCNATVPNRTVPNQPNQTVQYSTNRTEQDSTPLSPTSGEDGVDGGAENFDRFWSAYPKKVGKGEARKAWNKIKPGKALAQKILEAIPRALQSDQWRRENGRFIPNPATWLNQGRWEDELTTGGGDDRGQAAPAGGSFTRPAAPREDWDSFKPSTGFKRSSADSE